MPEPETVSSDQAPAIASRRFVTINEAADIAFVSRRSIYLWLKAGKLKFRRTAGGSIRIDQQSLWQKGSAREANQ